MGDFKWNALICGLVLMCKIQLSQNEFALVDEEDYKELNKYNWYVSNEGTNKYAARKARKGEEGWINGKHSKTIRMHRVILNAPEGTQIDHINGNGLDNRKENLMFTTQRQNTQNKHIKKTSKYPGVYYDKNRKKWAASIRINGVKKFLERHDTEEEAYEAYLLELNKNDEKIHPKFETEVWKG